MRRIGTGIAILLLAWAHCHAQTVLTLNAGDRLRITVDGTRSVVVVKDVQEDELLFQRERGGSRGRVRIEAIESLEIPTPRTRREGVLHGARWGFVIGLAGGVATGLISGDDPPCPGQEFCFGLNAGDKAFFLGLLGSVAGAIVGGAVGGISPGVAWEPIDLPVHVELIAAGGKAAAGGIAGVH
jgi:hypothetical protein